MRSRNATRASLEARTNKPNFFEIRVGEAGETQTWSSNCAWTCRAANMQLCSSSDAAQFSLRTLITTNTRVLHDKLNCTRKGKSDARTFLHSSRPVGGEQSELCSMRSRTAKRASLEARMNKPPSARLEATLQRALGQPRGQAGEQLLEMQLVVVGLAKICDRTLQTSRNCTCLDTPTTVCTSERSPLKGSPNWGHGERKCSSTCWPPRSKNLL